MYACIYVCMYSRFGGLVSDSEVMVIKHVYQVHSLDSHCPCVCAYTHINMYSPSR